MSDAKVKIAVQLDGDAMAAQNVEKLQRAVEELGGAQTRDAAAAKQATTALQANTGAQRQNAGATDKATKALQGNTAAQRENARAAKEAGKAAQAAGGGLKAQSELAGNASKAMGSLQLANQSFVRLMQGDVVGAVKMGTQAVKDFFAAIVANPAMLALSAIAGAVAGVVYAWRDAKQAAAEYAERLAGIREIEAQSAARRRGPTDLGLLDDAELARRIQRAGEVYEGAENSVAIHARMSRQASQDWRDRGFWSRSYEKAGNWIAGTQTDAEQQIEALNEANARAEAARAQLEELKAEQARRASSRGTAAQSAADTRKGLDQRKADFEEQKRYDSIESAAELAKKGSGRLAGLEARRNDLQAKLDDPYNFLGEPEKRQELVEKVYSLEKQITEEKERQADLEKQRNEVQADWERKRRLEKMEAGERAKSIEGEMAALRKGPRNAETEAKMRRLVEERDQAQAQAKRERDAQADWARGRKLKGMDAAERVKAIDAEIAELRKGPRNAETEAKMRRLYDERDSAKVQVKTEAERASKDAEKGKTGGEEEKKRGGIRKSAAQRAAEARRAAWQDQQAERHKRASGLSQWHATAMGPKRTWGLGRMEKAEKKSPEAEATERGNAILEEIREALK